MTIKIYTDGGSRGNPGKSAGSYVVVNDALPRALTKLESIIYKEIKIKK